jgi:S1-C subfamily serine protease
MLLAASLLAADPPADRPPPLPPPAEGAVPLPPPSGARGTPTPQPGTTPAPAPRGPACPRCGYRVEPEWRYCPACGWDLRTLAGAAADEHLEELEHSVMGLVVTRSKLRASDILDPKTVKMLKHYRMLDDHAGGERKVFGTAIPIGDGLYVTPARLLVRGLTAQLRSTSNHFYPATILGYDLATGVGVVKTEARGAAVPPAAGPDAIAPGPSWVICYPMAFDEDLATYLPVSLHRGRITATGQSGTDLVAFEDLLRSDHTIPDGCEGGLLVDARGAALGMVLGGPDAGVTYAAALWALRPAALALSRGEAPAVPYFGFALAEPDGRLRARFDLPPDATGPLLPYLIAGSPAAAAGLLAGDRLIAVGGEPVATLSQAAARLLRAPAGGAPVGLRVLCAGRQVDLEVHPTRRPRRILLDPADELRESMQANLVEVITGPSSGPRTRRQEPGAGRAGRGGRLPRRRHHLEGRRPAGPPAGNVQRSGPRPEQPRLRGGGRGPGCARDLYSRARGAHGRRREGHAHVHEPVPGSSDGTRVLIAVGRPAAGGETSACGCDPVTRFVRVPHAPWPA